MIGERVNVIQGSDEWHRLRLGVITASKLQKCFTGKLAISKAGCKTLAKELAAELVYKKNEEIPQNFSTYAMDRGNLLEPEAVETIAEMVKQDSPELILKPGAFYLNDLINVGASPDGEFFGPEKVIDMGLEVKCPLPKGHLEYLLQCQEEERETPVEHYAQVQLNMMLTGAKKWLFASYCPGAVMHLGYQERDEEFISLIMLVVESVNNQLNHFRRVLGV